MSTSMRSGSASTPTRPADLGELDERGHGVIKAVRPPRDTGFPDSRAPPAEHERRLGTVLAATDRSPRDRAAPGPDPAPRRAHSCPPGPSRESEGRRCRFRRVSRRDAAESAAVRRGVSVSVIPAYARRGQARTARRSGARGPRPRRADPPDARKAQYQQDPDHGDDGLLDSTGRVGEETYDDLDEQQRNNGKQQAAEQQLQHADECRARTSCASAPRLDWGLAPPGGA